MILTSIHHVLEYPRYTADKYIKLFENYFFQILQLQQFPSMPLKFEGKSEVTYMLRDREP